MARASADPAPGGSDWLIEALGEGRTRRRFVELLALGGLCGTVGFGSALYYEIKREPMVERMPLVFDSNLQLVGRLGGPVDPTLIDRIAVERARDWVLVYRSRPGDERTAQDNLNRLAQLTDAKLYPRIGEKLEEHRKEYGRSVVEVSRVKPNLESRIDAFRRLVRVDWDEKLLAGATREASYSATITVAFAEVGTLDEFGRNIAGFYITDAQITLTGEGR